MLDKSFLYLGWVANQMDRFTIKCAHRGSTLEFFAREPECASGPIDYFSVRLTNANLDASARVYAYGPSPAGLFEQIATEWRGWPDVKIWESLEGELCIKCSNDRRGHITIAVALRSGHYELDWFVETAVVAEAGQLDEIARRAREFFGPGA